MTVNQGVRIALEAELLRQDPTLLCYTHISFFVHILYWLTNLYLITLH